MSWLTSDEFKIVNALSPADYNAGTGCEPCAVVNMGRFQSMVAVVQMGSMVTTPTIFVYEYTAAAATSGQALATWNYRLSGNSPTTGVTTATTDVLGARTAGASTGIAAPTTAKNCAYVIEVKSDDLDDGYPYIGINISTDAQISNYAVTYVMKPRYPMYTQISALS